MKGRLERQREIVADWLTETRSLLIECETAGQDIAALGGLAGELENLASETDIVIDIAEQELACPQLSPIGDMTPAAKPDTDSPGLTL